MATTLRWQRYDLLSMNDSAEVLGRKLVRGSAGLGIVAREHLRAVSLSLRNNAHVEAGVEQFG